MRTGRLVLYEGWDLANSAAWDPVRWTTGAAGSATVNVQGAKGRIALPGVTGGFAESGEGTPGRVLTGAGDFEIVFDITISSVTVETYPQVHVGDATQVNWPAPSNGVGVVPDPSHNQLYLQRYDANASTNLANGPFTYVAGTTHRVRFRREGIFLAARIWTPIDPEPSDWTVTTTETLYRGPDYGILTVGISNGATAGAVSVDYDDLYVYELVGGPPRRHRPFTRKGIVLNQRSPMHLLAR